MCVYRFNITSSLNDGKTFGDWNVDCSCIREYRNEMSASACVCAVRNCPTLCEKFLSHLVGIYSKIWKILRNGVLQIQIDLVAMVIVMVYIGLPLPLQLESPWNERMCSSVWECVCVLRRCTVYTQLYVENWKNAKWMKEFVVTYDNFHKTCIQPPTAIDLIKQEVVSFKRTTIQFSSHPKWDSVVEANAFKFHASFNEV